MLVHLPMAYLPDRTGRVFIASLALSIAVTSVVSIRHGGGLGRPTLRNSISGVVGLAIAVALGVAAATVNFGGCRSCGGGGWGGWFFEVLLAVWLAVLGYRMWKDIHASKPQDRSDPDR